MVSRLATCVQNQIVVKVGATTKSIVEIHTSSWTIEMNISFDRVHARLGLKVKRRLLLPNSDFSYKVVDDLIVAGVIAVGAVPAHSINSLNSLRVAPRCDSTVSDPCKL